MTDDKKAYDTAANAHKILCAHIRTALTTPSGKVLREWLRDNCFMSEPMTMEAAESAASNYRVNARRDLYVTLEHLLMEGLDYAGTE